MRGLPDCRFCKLALRIAAERVVTFVMQKSGFVQRTGKLLLNRRDVELPGHTHQQFAQIQLRVAAVKELEAGNQWRRYDQHRVRISERIANQQPWLILDWRWHKVQIHPQPGQEL